MAEIIYCHPSQTHYDFHLFTNLDFWDALKILRGLALVKRNFGKDPPGKNFPTQVVGNDISAEGKKDIEYRLKKAVISPARHVVVESVLRHGSFEFNPAKYYPSSWSKSRMMHFTSYRLPLFQSPLSTPHKTVRLYWSGNRIRLEQIQREKKYDPVIRTRKEAIRRLKVPSCF
jgi:hypothetical protein